MTFTEAFDNALEKLSKLKNNRITNFAYDEQAYDTDTVDGVTDYDFDRNQNIPVSTPTVIQANETMLKKGFRSQASSLPRMFLNHFFGRTSYNVNKIVDYLISFLTDFKSTFSSGQGVATLDAEGKLVKEQFPYDFGENEGVATLKDGKLKKEQFPYPFGEANGVATLDSSGKIPASQLAETVVEYKGEWNALTNEPELSDSVGDFGDLYYISTARPDASGHSFLPDTTFTVGDRILKGRNGYFKISGGSVKSINDIVPNSVGNVSINADNIPFEEGKSIKERFNELPTAEGVVKSVNTVLPDSNGNVTISIPSDLGRIDENGNIFIGDLTLDDIPLATKPKDTAYDIQEGQLVKQYGEDCLTSQGIVVPNEDAEMLEKYPQVFKGVVTVDHSKKSYNATVGRFNHIFINNRQSYISIKNSNINVIQNDTEVIRFKSLLNQKWQELGFSSNISNTVNFVYKEV